MHFPNLKELDCQSFSSRQSLKDAKSLKQILIPFLIKLESLSEQMAKGTDDREYSEIIEIIESAPLSGKKSVSALLNQLESLRSKLLTHTHGNTILKDLDHPTSKQVFRMFKKLFFEVIFGLKSQKNNELVKWITYRLFKKYPGLLRFVCAKHGVKFAREDARCVESAVCKMLEDP